MSWNYRVFHTAYAPPGATEVVDYYSFREVYFESSGDISGLGSEAARPSGSTLTELMQDHARMQEAWTLPVLTPADIPGYQLGKYECQPEGRYLPHERM
jgi:hypothetical protein